MAACDLFGDVISTYTRAQALDDGVLVDLCAVAPDVCSQHYRHPIACTGAVWDLICRAVRHPRWMQDVPGIVHDILWMSRVRHRVVDPSTVAFSVLIRGTGRQRIHPMRLVVGPGDAGEPVITILLDGED